MNANKILYKLKVNMFCKNCGKEIGINSKFCSRCGEKISRRFLWRKLLGSLGASIFIAPLFLILCLPFLKDASNVSYADAATIGNINLWRISVVFGILSALSTIYLFFRKKEYKFIILFLWLFWALGTCLVFTLTYRTGGFQLRSASVNASPLDLIESAILTTISLPYFIWLFGIYYCRKIANQIGKSGSKAILAGTFLPVLSIVLYFYFSYKKKDKKQKIKTLKTLAGTVVVVALISAGAFYYILGTPEYSLIKLRQAIVSNNTKEFGKYMDIDSVAENFGESPAQLKEWIDSLNTSVLEIKEENPDKSKDSLAYINTDLSGKNLENASLSFTNNNDAIISLKFDDTGTKLFTDITKRNTGKQLAIFLSGNLVSSQIVQTEITNGEAIISGQNSTQAKLLVDAINEEKNSQIDGFKIRKREIDETFAKITIEKNSNMNGFELSMTKMDGRYWKVDKIDTVIIENGEAKLPSQEGEKEAKFDWKYKGKSYSVDEKLYDSYYKFYNSLPVKDVFNGESLLGSLEKDNTLFINEFEADKTIRDLARSLKELGEKNSLNENQIVELVATFVQTIPYDNEKYANRKAGLNGKTEKPTYPYEVLYDNKGVCQDKSYLTYVLLKEMGYGVSLFLFPDPADNHMAVGVKCPIEYSNYDSGYCFLETTSLGNKIGSQPNLSKEFGVATAKMELSDYSSDLTESENNPLGRIEILNKIDGLTYTGIIETVKTQKGLDNMLATIRGMDRELDALGQDLDNQDEKLGDMVDKLKKLEKNLTYNNYDDYSSYYSKYKKAYSDLEKDRKAFNAKIAARNQLNNRYNSLLRSFYQ